VLEGVAATGYKLLLPLKDSLNKHCYIVTFVNIGRHAAILQCERCFIEKTVLFVFCILCNNNVYFMAVV